MKCAPKKQLWLLVLLMAGSLVPGNSIAADSAVNTFLTELALETDNPFSSEAGRSAWYKDVNGRSCTSCHLDSLDTPGRHEKTGKIIEPMAPSVNPSRLTDVKKMKKWFLRNCKWTYGRECSAQEKGDFLTWLVSQ